MAWNREHDGVPAAPSAAIDWSVTAMTEAVERFGWSGAWDLPRAAAAVSETVWWITLVDATLVRYHPCAYENTLSGQASGMRLKTEQTLAGLRYVRNILGCSTGSPGLIRCAHGGDPAWLWSPVPEPRLAGLTGSAREWEMSRYRAYQARLAGRNVTRTFARCAAFLERAAAAASLDITPLVSVDAAS